MDHLTNCINQVNKKVYDVAQSYDHTMENLDLTIQEHLLHGLGSKGFSEGWLQAVNNRLDFLRNCLIATKKARFLLDTRRSSELQKLSSNLESISKRIDILMIKKDNPSHIIDLDPEDPMGEKLSKAEIAEMLKPFQDQLNEIKEELKAHQFDTAEITLEFPQVKSTVENLAQYNNIEAIGHIETINSLKKEVEELKDRLTHQEESHQTQESQNFQ